MKKNVIIIFIASILLLFSNCGSHEENLSENLINKEDTPQPEVPSQTEAVFNPIKLTEQERVIVNKQTEFAVTVFDKILDKDKGDNFVISPLSLEYSLCMLANATDVEGQGSILNKLQYDDMSDLNEFYKHIATDLVNVDPVNVDFVCANSIWFNNDLGIKIDDYYLNVAKSVFQSDLTYASFLNAPIDKLVNEWAKTKTNGLIDNILNEKHRFASFILTNALYFKAPWTNKFQKDRTNKENFEDAGLVEMMHISTNADLYQTDNAVGVALPYGNSTFEFVVCVPNEKNDIQQAISQISVSNSSESAIDLSLPKFMFDTENEIGDILKTCGIPIKNMVMEHILVNGSVTTSMDINIKQKCVVQVDEEGTEAAAVTTVMDATLLPGNDCFRLKVDKPFGFFIREKSSGIILFMGAVFDPNK